ncbi:hypothetical protein Taro_026542 [Colocasia esculenta]|uniref:Uncharacterized protein n=1 Tax=Colocasia esculenta TaxID=4460 RepID=A0A843VJU6_COLES|nr:hypothetical protein [Colocasia esculenta]
MASIAPSAWAPPPSTSMAARSSHTSPKLALVLSLKHHKGRRLGGALVVRVSPAEPLERTTPDEEPAATDRVKLALARAKAYKKERSATAAPEGNTGGGSVLSVAGGAADGEDAESVKVVLERSKEYANSQGAPAAGPVGVLEGDGGGESPAAPESVKLAMERAREYEANTGGVEQPGGASEESGNVAPAVPDSVKLAMEKAREYKKNKGAVGGSGDVAQKEPRNTGLEKMKVDNPESTVMENKVQKPGELKISSIDFVGLEFSEKKNRGVPAGLVPIVDNISDGDLPEVEIIVGDASKFGSSAPSFLNSNEVDEDAGLYKPKVSTWGVFPRPSNISKTFGGGRNICPGEVLESADTKAAKEERTRQLISNYKSQIGLTVDAKLKAYCEKV